MRNHSVQYTAEPEFNWYKLRRTWPWVYESHADLKLETWMKVRIEVKGRSAKLFLNGSDEPTLIVDGLKGQDLKGGVALWGYQGEEAYFSNVRITNLDPAPVKNGSDAAGTWQVNCSTDIGPIKGTLTLARDGDKVAGKWSGDLGDGVPVSGAWRDGYVKLTFPAAWKFPDAQGRAPATLAGWIDGDSAGGRMKVETLTDGRWTATRKAQ